MVGMELGKQLEPIKDEIDLDIIVQGDQVARSRARSCC